MKKIFNFILLFLLCGTLQSYASIQKEHAISQSNTDTAKYVLSLYVQSNDIEKVSFDVYHSFGTEQFFISQEPKTEDVTLYGKRYMVLKYIVPSDKSIMIETHTDFAQNTFTDKWVNAKDTLEVLSTDSNYVYYSYQDTSMILYIKEAKKLQYVKIDDIQENYNGEFILTYIVNDTLAYIWNGTDNVNNYVAKPITNGIIYSTDMEDIVTVSFSDAPGTNTYNVRVNSGNNEGKYIYGSTSKNMINFSNATNDNTTHEIAFGNNGEFFLNNIVSAANYPMMQFNKTNGQMRFRYYKTANQQNIYLFKKTKYQNVPTKIDNNTQEEKNISNKAKKYIDKNGQVVILRNGIRYNALGAIIE